MAKDLSGKETGVMQANGAGGVLGSGGLGRGNMDASSKMGNDGLRAPLTTSTYDARDKGHHNLHQHLEATRETPPAKPGRGMHDKNLLGG